MKFSPRFEIISSPDKSPDRRAFFNTSNSNPNMNNYRVIQPAMFGRRSIHFRFAGIGRRKNRSISPDSWQLTAMNGTLINRQRGRAMYSWLDCFDSNHSRIPGLVDAGCTNFLLPTSCPPARNSNCSLIATSSFSSNYLRAWKLEFSRKRTSVSIRGRILSNRKKLWTMIRSKRTRRKNTIPETIHLFLPLNHLKRLSRIGFTANNSLARRFKVVSLTCAR